MTIPQLTEEATAAIHSLCMIPCTCDKQYRTYNVPDPACYRCHLTPEIDILALWLDSASVQVTTNCATIN